MASLTFDNVTKSFGSNTVIKSFDAQVDDNEFLVLLGPSGCGKSTMLRMIAGLSDISSGTLKFDDKPVNRLTPKQRNIAFVFQSYALYPHMSVRANIAFPLVMDNFKWWHHIPVVGTLVRRHLVKRPDIVENVERVAEMLELTDYLDRRPKALSGGQRQRVAVARSIIREPSLYLFDEPLSNLDAKLRTQMRTEISALHDRVQKTFVYVTHDQVEAMTMGTRIVVLNEGVIQQYGTPDDVYNEPANTFVARFIGAPPMNILRGDVAEGRLRMSNIPVAGSEELASRMENADHTDVQVGVRAEKLVPKGLSNAGSLEIDARVTFVEHLGAETIIGFTLAGGADDSLTMAANELHQARLPGVYQFETGQALTLTFEQKDVHLFDRQTGDRIELP